MTDVQRLVKDLQAKLGYTFRKGQITLNVSDGLFQNAEIRICGLTDVAAPPRIVDNRVRTVDNLTR